VDGQQVLDGNIKLDDSTNVQAVALLDQGALRSIAEQTNIFEQVGEHGEFETGSDGGQVEAGDDLT
jgi:hypothetical protein